MNPKLVEVIAFDLFGTVFDMDGVPKSELKAYGDHIQQVKWSPLELPESWRFLAPYPDVRDALRYLKEKYTVVTLSNAPIGLQTRLLRNSYLDFDMLIPLELYQLFKPNPLSYQTICSLLKVKPENVLMVSANEHFGDLEASVGVGMQSQLIRGRSGIRDLDDLNNYLRL